MCRTLAAVVAVGCGGFIGATLRYCVQSLPVFEGIGYLATFSVNMAGSFLIGASWIILSAYFPTDNGIYTFIVPGILGGFTTYSSFSLDFVKLMQTGRHVTAGAYCCATIAGGFAACVLGMYVASRVLKLLQ